MNYHDMTEAELLLARQAIEAELQQRKQAREADEMAKLKDEIMERARRHGGRLDLRDSEQARGVGKVFPIPF